MKLEEAKAILDKSSKFHLQVDREPNKFDIAIQTVLNELDIKDTELQQVLNDYQELGKDYHKLECESERKDTEINKLKNAIDKMAKRIKEDLKLEYGIMDRTVEEIKEYFMKEEK